MKKVVTCFMVVMFILSFFSVSFATEKISPSTSMYADILKSELAMEFKEVQRRGEFVFFTFLVPENLAGCTFAVNKHGVIVQSALVVPSMQKLNSYNVGKWIGYTFAIMENDAGTFSSAKAEVFSKLILPYIEKGQKSPPIYFSSAIWEVKFLNGRGVVQATRRTDNFKNSSFTKPTI
jgi:hypothetical protein